ncbi:hypothetical protein ES332_A01G007000v1 [Gossypium tomentosum]|uniref:DUF7798 domain-containing protein n=1 Tax=Gossypium tomentosum TaxID=34277 RepID=A0A5D2RP13_GOSTO|nr:hypothetical protein ES332_A01G007000v1 [Gossypium tomentosum]
MEATKIPPPQKMEDKDEKECPEDEEEPKSGGGWGGWVYSTFSVLSDLQKAAAYAAEEITLNVAEKAAKTIADIQVAEDSECSSKEEEAEESSIEKDSEDHESEKLRKSALDRLEHSTVNFADSMHRGSLPAGSVAPSSIKNRKPFTTKGMQVLEYVGKETMELLINETGIEPEMNTKRNEQSSEEDRLLEEVSFNQCFYIYGGPEQLEELESLSSHYALLFNRRKTTLPPKQKSMFINALTGLAVNDIIQRTSRRLESLHSEGVHMVSELCCLAVSHLLMLAKSVISSGNKVRVEDPDDDDGDDIMNIDWPEDPVEKAKLIRVEAQSMTCYTEAVSNNFITGIFYVTKALRSSRESATVDSHEALPQASIKEKAKSFSKHLHNDWATAVSKI